jgi:hypothetical protein
VPARRPSGIPGVLAAYDDVGWSLTAVRVTASGRDDLLVGAPATTVGAGAHQNGEMLFLPGSQTGPTATGSQAWSDQSPGIKGGLCNACAFGFSVG